MSKLRRRQLPQFAINERQQLLSSRRIAGFDLREYTGDVGQNGTSARKSHRGKRLVIFLECLSLTLSKSLRQFVRVDFVVIGAGTTAFPKCLASYIVCNEP